MVEVVCDRCGRKCVGTYYTVKIYGHDVNPSPDGAVTTTATAIQNLSQNMAIITGKEKQFCRECKEEIRKITEEVLKNEN